LKRRALRAQESCDDLRGRMPPNVLAFSCEAANVTIECSQNMARLRLLQRRVRPAAGTTPCRPCEPHLPRSCASSPASRAGAWRIPVESLAISLPRARALVAHHRRVMHNAFIRDKPDGFYASGPAHSIPAHHAHAGRHTPATAISLATQPINSSCSSRCSWRGLTSHSPANYSIPPPPNPATFAAVRNSRYPLPSPQPIHRTPHRQPPPIQHVRVNHRRTHVAVPQ
jgi:hypothetical protein